MYAWFLKSLLHRMVAYACTSAIYYCLHKIKPKPKELVKQDILLQFVYTRGAINIANENGIVTKQILKKD